MQDEPAKKLFGERPSESVCAELRVADVLALRPTWSEAEAAFFLRVCAQNLAAAMLRAGTFELACLIKAGERLIELEEQNPGDSQQPG